MKFTAEDRGDHYLVDEGSGPFRVPKSGLDPKVEKRIREGGVVGESPAHPIVTTLPLVPKPVQDIFRALTGTDKKDVESDEDLPEEDEPEVQAFAEGGRVQSEPGQYLVEDPAGGKPLRVVDEGTDYYSEDSQPLRVVDEGTDYYSEDSQPAPAPLYSSEPEDSKSSPGPLYSSEPEGPPAPASTKMYDDYVAGFRERQAGAALERSNRLLAEQRAARDQAGTFSLDRTPEDGTVTVADLLNPFADITKAPLRARGEEQRTEAPLRPPTPVPDLGYEDDDVDLQRPFSETALGGSFSVSGTSGPAPGRAKDFAGNPVFERAAEESKESLRKFTEVSQRAAEEEAAHKADVARRTELAEADRVKQTAENDALKKKYTEEIRNTKIDPNNFYGSRSTGQKVSAFAAIILGGLGSTLSGVGRGGSKGRNVGLAILERAAEQDVDAQKANLANKHSHLRSLIQAGHDIQSASQIAKGHILSVAALELEGLQAKYTGLKGDAQLGGLLAEIDVAAQKNISEGISKDVENHYKPRVYEAQMAKLRQERFAMVASARASAEAAYNKEGLLQRFQRKQATDADWREVMSNPKEYGDIPKLMIKMPDGRYGMYNGGASGAEKFREQVENIDEVRSSLVRIRELAVENRDSSGAWRVPLTRDEAQYLSIESILSRVKGSGMGAWDDGLKKLLSPLQIDANGIFTMTENSLSVLDAMIKTGDLEYQRILDQKLTGPNIGQSTSRKRAL